MAWMSRTVCPSPNARSLCGSRPPLHAVDSRLLRSCPRPLGNRTSRTGTIPWDQPFGRETRERLARCPVVQLRRRLHRRSSRTSVQPTSRSSRTSRLGVCPESNRRAEMTMTVAIKARGTMGDMFSKVVDFTLDNSYPTGGWPVLAQACGYGANGTILYVDITSAKLGYLLEYDHVANKIKA